MKHFLIFFLFIPYSTVTTLSQGALREFIIEEDIPPPGLDIFKECGCFPDDGVIVFNTKIPDLEFSIPDAPSRLRHLSPFDTKNKRYVLCVQPTDGIGGYTKYSILVNGKDYKPVPQLVSSIKPGLAQYFKINPKPEGTVLLPKELNFVIQGLDKKNNASVKIYLDNVQIGETNYSKGSRLKYIDTNPDMDIHDLNLVLSDKEWKGKINTKSKTYFVFEYKKKKTGFGYEYLIELLE